MARPKKQTVDYFPHFIKGGRTIFILESKFGNDGYAFWFKVLEILGGSEGHFYDCSNASNWEFLLAKTRVTDETAKDIIGVLIDLGKIDAELWNEHRVIWITNFLRNLSEVYRTRHTDLPSKPVLNAKKQEETPISTDKTDEEQGFSTRKPAKEKESKEKERKYPYQDICDLWNSICVSLPKVQKLSDSRRQKIRCRLDEFGVPAEQMTETARCLFERVQASDFLTGRQPNKTGWTATFDWLFENGSNWVKVQEGNYDNDRGGRNHQTTVQAGNVKINLGAGEFIDNSGRRTYGTGKATIPPTAPPRPSEKHAWDSSSETWILL